MTEIHIRPTICGIVSLVPPQRWPRLGARWRVMGGDEADYDAVPGVTRCGDGMILNMDEMRRCSARWYPSRAPVVVVDAEREEREWQEFMAAAREAIAAGAYR